MEDQVVPGHTTPAPAPADPHRQRVRVRVRVHKKRTLLERIKKALEMPKLKRRDRNQRVAIGGVLLLFLIYLVVLRPIINWMMPVEKPKSSQISIPKGLNPTKR